MRTDFQSLNNGDQIRLYPRPDNPRHRKPFLVTFHGGDYFCDPKGRADYYYGDVEQYNQGFMLIDPPGVQGYPFN